MFLVQVVVDDLDELGLTVTAQLPEEDTSIVVLVDIVDLVEDDLGRVVGGQDAGGGVVHPRTISSRIVEGGIAVGNVVVLNVIIVQHTGVIPRLQVAIFQISGRKKEGEKWNGGENNSRLWGHLKKAGTCHCWHC